MTASVVPNGFPRRPEPRSELFDFGDWAVITTSSMDSALGPRANFLTQVASRGLTYFNYFTIKVPPEHRRRFVIKYPPDLTDVLVASRTPIDIQNPETIRVIRANLFR
jgi:hypothetical protein